MTPDEFIYEVGRMVESGRDQDALDFAAEVGPNVMPALNFDQIDQLGGLLEGAAMAVAMAGATAAREAAGTGSSAAAVGRARPARG